MDYCRKHIEKYAMPYDIEFKDDMPKTLVGKVAYRVLEEQEFKKNNILKINTSENIEHNSAQKYGEKREKINSVGN